MVEGQANIACRLLHVYLDGDTAIAEWLAKFCDVAQGVRKRMREIAVLEFDGHLIRSLREYWASEVVQGREDHDPTWSSRQATPSALLALQGRQST